MAYKIMIDAGHGGTDPGAVYEGRQEKDDALRLALAVGDILSRNGVDVEYTRTGDVYQTPFEKAQIGSPDPNQYSGVETLVYDQSGQKLDMAQNINGALGELGFREIGVKSRPGLVVLRRTKMPAVLVEAGFINSDEDNEIFDSQFQDVAQAIASAILGTLNEEAVENTENSQDLFYRVQTGSFRERSNADNLLYELEDQGFPAFILREDGLYKVQVGAFKNLDNAVKMERALRSAGYSTWIDAAPASY